jgi:hypothetical protein
MSAFSDFLLLLDAKLKTCSVITSADNVVFGETTDIMGLQDSSFPRLETLIVKIPDEGYQAQTDKKWNLSMATAGYIKLTEDSDFVSAADYSRIIDMAYEVSTLIASFNEDKQTGLITVDSFLQVGDFSDIFIDKELIPQTLSMMFAYSFDFYL